MEFTVLIRIFVGIMLTKESSAVTFNSSVIMGQEIDALKANMRVISDCFMSRTNDANARLEKGENQIEIFGEQIETLKTQMEGVIVDINRRFEDMVSDMNQVRAKNDQLASQLTILKNDNQILKSAVFSAYGIHRYENRRVNIDGGQRIIYHYTTTNPGGRYSTSTGIYTCPVSGVYFFQFSIYGYFIRDVEAAVASAALMKNGNHLAEVVIFNFGSEGIHNTMSNAMVVQCNAGERVWVESEHDNTRLHNWPALNRFSGFLISPQ